MKLLLILLFSSLLPVMVLSQEIQLRIAMKDGAVQSFPVNEIRKITFSGLIGITEQDMPKIVSNLMLISNYPNPFSESTTIEYELPEAGPVEAFISDINGRFICFLVNENQSEGKQTLSWNSKDQQGNSMPTGIYFCTVKFNHQIVSKKLIMVK